MKWGERPIIAHTPYLDVLMLHVHSDKQNLKNVKLNNLSLVTYNGLVAREKTNLSAI